MPHLLCFRKQLTNWRYKQHLHLESSGRDYTETWISFFCFLSQLNQISSVHLHLVTLIHCAPSRSNYLTGFLEKLLHFSQEHFQRTLLEGWSWFSNSLFFQFEVTLRIKGSKFVYSYKKTSQKFLTVEKIYVT